VLLRVFFFSVIFWKKSRRGGKMASNTVSELKELIEHVPAKLHELSRESMVIPRSAGKWSNQQILGHLCDSAVNNLGRFIQAQYMPEPFVITPYDQDEWVAKQSYKHASIDEVIDLWVSLNRSIARVIASLPSAAALARTVKLPNGEIETLVAY
jgi:hypothetical protein